MRSYKELKKKAEKDFEYYESNYDKYEFNDIAPIYIYLNADSQYSKEARQALKNLKRKFPEDFKDVSFRDLETYDISWRYIYNSIFEDILNEYGYESETDRYGSYGWTDEEGNKHFGDDLYTFPYYLDEEELRNNLSQEKK